MKAIPYLTLNTGAPIPVLGLGTWKSQPTEVGQAVTYALTEGGYNHIDCAWIYGNEKEIGESFKKVFEGGKVKRDEVFVTSKLWSSFHAKKNVAPACKETLENLKLDHLDLYLMHWGIATPPGELEPLDKDGVLITENVSIRETWEEMEGLVSAGLVKAIGVSNFTAPMIVDLLSYAKIPPAVNQIELHPYLQQTRLVEFCQRKGITLTAYSPLGRPGAPAPRPFLEGKNSEGRLVDEKIITDIAARRKKTPPQVLLRWGIQRNTVVIPKSVTPARIQENIDIFDFELSEEEMQAIATLDRKQRFVDLYAWSKIPYFD